MTTQRILAATATAFADVDVERNAAGVPVAFRIWRAGVNPTDHGDHVLTPNSVATLLVSQVTRGNRFSIDVDHMSLNSQAPPENHKAVGWFEIEERDGDLWAVNVRWTDDVRAGLAKDPPEWRYFSPAYDTKKDSGEIVRLLNLALTNNPATHHVTALATATAGGAQTTERNMNAKAIADEAERIIMQKISGLDERREVERILARLPAADRETYKGLSLAQLDRVLKRHHAGVIHARHQGHLPPNERAALDAEMGISAKGGWLVREVGTTLEFNGYATTADARRALEMVDAEQRTVFASHKASMRPGETPDRGAVRAEAFARALEKNGGII